MKEIFQRGFDGRLHKVAIPLIAPDLVLSIAALYFPYPLETILESAHFESGVDGNSIVRDGKGNEIAIILANYNSRELPEKGTIDLLVAGINDGQFSSTQLLTICDLDTESCQFFQTEMPAVKINDRGLEEIDQSFWRHLGKTAELETITSAEARNYLELLGLVPALS